MEYEYLIYLAVILLSTKLFGLFSRRVHLPAVVGALLAGIVLGQSGLHLIPLNGEVGQFISMVAELGVIFLMFHAGLETDLGELRANALSSAITAVLGVVLPLLGGLLVYLLFYHGQADSLLRGFFVGTVLTATSVSITVETLRELGKLKGRVGTVILGAAVIDDILGIVVLTVVTSLKDPSVHPVTVLLRLVAYMVLLAVVFFVLKHIKTRLEKYDHLRRTAIMGVVFCLVLAYISEAWFGVADITGAYFAGLMLCESKLYPYVARRIEIPSYLFFSPVFFASVGLKVSLGSMDLVSWLFALVLLLVAILTKVMGCSFGARLCHIGRWPALQIGIGMVSRGEVALIVAQKGFKEGLLAHQLFGPIILVVIVTTLLTPILLKLGFEKEKQYLSQVRG